MKEFIKTHKGLAIGIGAVVAAAVIALVVWLVLRDGFRTIQVYQLDGTVEVTRQTQTMTPYVNMMLESGDAAETFTESHLYLEMDGDKYMLAEPETRFSLIAEGTRKNSRTKIHLEAGGIVNHITKPLGDNGSYEVTTPNSVMAVRGTSFRVFVWTDEEGVTHTILQVFEGIVEVHLLYPDGSLSEEGRRFEAGTTVSIWGNDETSDYDYVLDEIDYISLSIPTLEFLKIGIRGLDDYSITLPAVDEIIRLKQTYFPVHFMNGEQEFGTQSILFDNLASEPTISPTAEGHWDFDFSQVIREETTIQWVEE